MGALALIFAVGIGFLIVQNVMSPLNAELTQANTNAASADNIVVNEAADSAKMANSNTSLPADDLKVSEENANTSADPATDSADRSPETPGDGISDKNETSVVKKESDERFGKNKQESNGGRSGSLKRDEPSDKTLSTETDSDISVADDAAKLKEESRTRSQNDRGAANKPEAEAAPPPAPPVTVRRSNKPKPKKSERKDVQEEKNVSSGSATKRQISGKTFNRKNSVWYDSAYKGEPTTNVKRRTTQYQNLDSGLRSITDKLDGTVVLVWKSKAYRID
jgi:hypothetical protein